jgi:broad specificity phosphatase PhoE
MIILVRHGQTDLNVARIVQPADTPLSERGIHQAERVGARLAELGAKSVLSSDFPRARMTADAVVAATGAPLELLDLLQERNFGRLRGRAYAEVGQDIFAPDYAPPGGETWAEFDARVAQAWACVRAHAALAALPLVVVTHGLVCRSIAHQFLRLPAGVAAPERWGNTSVTICETEPPHAVSVLNSVAHLDGGDGSTAPSGI